MTDNTKRNWLIAAAVIGSMFAVRSCNLENMRRGYLGVSECVRYDPGATSDDAKELEAWRQCGSEAGWTRWKEVQRGQDDGSNDSGY